VRSEDPLQVKSLRVGVTRTDAHAYKYTAAWATVVIIKPQPGNSLDRFQVQI